MISAIIIKETVKTDIDQTVEIEEFHLSGRIQCGCNYRDKPRLYKRKL